MSQMNFRMIHLRCVFIIYLIVAVLLTHHIQAQQNGDIRLINNTILEAYLSGSWGAVCDDFWSLSNTHVACRELGFRRGLSYQHGIYSVTGRYHLDDVICLGNESSIIECTHRFGDDCSVPEQVWITCATDGCESYAPFADSVAITVKYYQGVQWYYISAEDFTNENAEVICRENTDRGVESHTYQSREALSSTNIYPFQFSCIGNESSLCECEKSQVSIASNLIVKIKCQSSEGRLKLLSGVNEHSGYVLINHEDAWKAICVSEDDSNFQLAYVACINLGYKGVYNYYYDKSLDDVINGGNYFYTRNRQMNSWVTRPQCTGNEESVTQCSGTWEDSVCGTFTLWVNCELHQLHDVELRSATGLQYEGEVYIIYNNKRSLLCLPDGVFNSTLGDAICRTVGATSYQSWRSFQSNNTEFLNLQYTCFGDEENLASCFFSLLGNRNCEILYLRCNPPVDETPRISYGSTEVGLVDVYDGQKWGLSCMSKSDILEVPDARVICRQLGLSGMRFKAFDYSIKQPQNYWNSVFNCIGTESGLSEGNCLQTTGYNSQCDLSTNVAAKIICRPSKNQLRLNPSTINTNFFRVEYLTPERTWAPVCDIPTGVELCHKFGFNAPDITRYADDNAHTYAQLECSSTDVDKCDVKFKYDYNSYYGCGDVLEVYCTNLTVPTIKPENIRAHVLSSSSALVIWDYLYEITETNMQMVYRYELTTSRYNYDPGNFAVYYWGRDHSRISRRYQVFNGLIPYSTYVLNLRLINAVGFGPYGNTVRFTTDETAPTGIPINVTILSIEASRFTIQWDELSLYERNGKILGYEVCIILSSSNDVCNSANTEIYTPGTTTPFQLQKSSLLPYTEYTVVIRAYNSKGYGPYSPSVSTKTDAISPEIILPVSNKSIIITSITELESFSFLIDCSSTGYPVPTVRWTSNTNVNPSGTVLSLRPENLELDTTNVFTCTATNIGGSDRKTVQIIINIQLSAPSAPIADAVDVTSIRIHWVEYASTIYNTSYTVCVRRLIDTSCTQTNHTTSTAISVRNLEVSTTYIISITVDTIFGTSPRSSSLSITTDDPEPVQPKIITPQQDIPITITNVTSFESFSLTQNCISTGIPTPSIIWTSNTNLNLNVNSGTLTLRTQDLNLDISVNIFTCTATNTAGQDSKRIRVTIEIEPNLPVPQSPTQLSIGINSVDIQWVEYISSVYTNNYEICVRSTADTECIQTINTISTQHSIGSLESRTTYSISIVADTVFGRSPASSALIVTTNEPEPVQPNITTPQQDRTIPISSIDEFQSFSLVQNCISTGLPAPSITWTSNTGRINVIGNVLSIGVSHLRRSSDLDVFICTAMNSVGQDTRQIRVEKSIQLPAAENPTVRSVSANSITIQWLRYDLANDVLNYEICVRRTNENRCRQRITAYNTQYTIGSLQASSQYMITIVAFTNFGTSPTSDSLIITTADPDPVRPEITIPVEDVSITISSIATFESFVHTQLCNSTGYPTLTITWTSNTSSTLNVISDTLTIRPGDLNLEISTNIFTCTATNTAGRDSKSIRVTIDILRRPPQPRQLSIGINSVDIQWVEYLSSVYINNYEICVRSTTDTECIQTINTVSIQHSIGSLESNTTYSISLVVNTVFGRSLASVALIVTTNEPELIPPDITTPQQDISLIISSVSGFESFSFTQDCISTGVLTPTITWTSNTSTLDVVDNRLSIEARHLDKMIEVNIFTCTATNSVGRDSKQILITNTIELSIPEKPTDVSISINSIEIQWPVYYIPDVLYYEICVSIPGGSGCEQSLETTDTRLTIRNLQSSTQYRITIVVFTDFGTSPRSIPLDTTTVEIVAARIVVPAQDQQITLTSLYQLETFTLTQECSAIGFPEPSIQWISNGAFYQSDSILTLEVGDLQGGIDMRFTCTASNYAGSDSKSIEIVTSIRVYPVGKLAVSRKDTDYIEIEWSGESQYLKYDVSYQICLRKSGGGDDCLQKVLSTETEYLFENLEDYTLYTITIVTITSFGRSLESQELEVETDQVVPAHETPVINEPSRDLSIKISTIEELDTFSINQLCRASGLPKPVSKWTSNTDYLSNDRLIIQSGNFSIDDVVNPYIFICTAQNSVGEDTRHIRIRVDIDLTEIIGNLSHVTSEILEEYSEIIQRNIQGVNYTYEQSSVVREVVDRSANNLASLVEKFNDTKADTDVLETILQTGDDIIQVELQQPVVEEVEETELEKGAVATASEGVIKTLNTVETVALNLLNNIPENETASVSISSLSITVVAENYVLPAEGDDIDILTIPDAEIVKERDIEEKIQIPISVARSLSKTSKNFRIATTIVKNDAKPKQEDSDKKVAKLSSNIVSVVVAGYERTKMISLPEPVRFIMPVPATDGLTQFQNCSHLNRSSWSTNGLTTNATNYNITFCDSDHFTSFAVFVTPREIPDDDLSRIASIVSYVLVSISFVALLISLILFLLSGKNFFKVEANIVYFNYCVAMTLAFGLFLFGIESGKFHIIVCMVIAFLLHYIWLAVFVWTLCNGILIMYKLTIGILREHKIYPYLIVFGWTSPIIIPIITIAIKHKNYVKPEQHCFITHEDGLIWSFIGPILIILFINLMVLAFATIRIATTKFGTEKIDEKQVLRKGLLSLLILTPLLGIPWLLLLLNVFLSNPIVQWSFILINGLMGVFFFLAITLRNTEVKKLCAKSMKESSHQTTSFSDGKSSGLLSKRFKKSVSKDSGEIVQSPLGPPSKGEYIPLGPVFEDSAFLKSSTSGGASRYDAPPVPKGLPKARKLSKESSEIEEHSRYDIPKNLRSVDPYTIDYDVLKPNSEFPIYEELRDENMIPEIESKPEIKSTKLSEKKLYQNLDSNP